MYDKHASRSFFERLSDVVRLCTLAVRLSWRASPRISLGILLLLVLQAALPPLQLWLSKAVLDRAAVDLGFGAPPSGLVLALPFAAWIVLTAAVVALSQIIEPISTTLQSLAGDRITGRITRELSPPPTDGGGSPGSRTLPSPTIWRRRDAAYPRPV